MTNVTRTETVSRRRKLGRVLAIGALAAGAVATFAVPAAAAPGPHYPGGGTTFQNQGYQGPDCGGRPYGFGWQSCPTRTPVSTPTAAPTTPAPATTPSSTATVAVRGKTINYNEGYAGSCVFYALDRFHQTTGVYPMAFGDARYLATGAAASGWSVGSTPRVNSLVVFQPGQNGAGAPTGHAAWVEKISGNQIYVSEMNAPTAYVVSYRWLTPAAGVQYIYTN